MGIDNALARPTKLQVGNVPLILFRGERRFHFNDKLTFYERACASLLELKNHFKEAFGNNYIDSVSYDSYCTRMDEIGYLLTRMMSGIRSARDSHIAGKKTPSRSS
jgi:hypothetical protein